MIQLAVIDAPPGMRTRREFRPARQIDVTADPSLPLLDRLCTAPAPQIVMVVVLSCVFPWAVWRGAGDHGCDILEFVTGANYAFEHGWRHPHTALNRYLPSLDVACMALAMLPLGATVAIYYWLNVGTWFALLRTVRDELLVGEKAARGRATMAAGLLCLPLAIDGFLIGTFHVLMVWLMVAGLLYASRDRHWKGGLLLGLSVWLKLLPVLGVGYLLLKGKWRSALIALAVVAVVDVGLSVPVFGWRGTWDEHLMWAAGGAVATFDDQVDGSESVDVDRITNQSTTVILRRLLTVRAGFPQLALADLSPRTLSIVLAGALLALGAMVLRALRRPAGQLSRAEWGKEIALVVLATLWFSPVAWSYHPTAVVPALAVVLQTAPENRKRLVSAVWLVAMALFAVPLARAVGHMMWASYVVGALLIMSMRRELHLAHFRAAELPLNRPAPTASAVRL